MAAPSGHDPLRELRAMQRRMNDLFESALARTNFDAADSLDAWTPVADVFECDGRLVVALEIPGVDRSAIDVRIDGDELVVAGDRGMEREHHGERYHRVERSYGSFERRFRLPSHVDRGSVRATFRNGLLSVTLPVKGGAAPEPLSISVD